LQKKTTLKYKHRKDNKELLELTKLKVEQEIEK